MNCPRVQRFPSRPAFTLVELLVVMAVITVLVGLLLPSVLAGRQASLQLKCKNQMRQLVMDELHSMKTPDIESMYLCPSDPELEYRKENNFRSYAWNRRFGDEQNNRERILTQRSSRWIILFEAASGYYDGSVEPGYWFSHYPHYDPNVAKERVYSQIDPKRHHSSVANYAFADGHIESISFSRIEDWIFDGHNFEFLDVEIR